MMWSTQKTIANLASKRGPLGYFFTQVLWAADVAEVSIQVLNDGVKRIHGKLEVRFPREYHVALVELVVSQILRERQEKLNTHNVLNPLLPPGSPLGSARDRSCARLPPAASFMKAIEVLSIIPRLIHRDSGAGIGPSQSMSSVRSSSRSSIRVGNPLTPRYSQSPAAKVDSAAFGPKVTFTETASPTCPLPAVYDIPSFSEAQADSGGHDLTDLLPAARGSGSSVAPPSSYAQSQGEASQPRNPAMAMERQSASRSNGSWVGDGNPVPEASNHEDNDVDILAARVQHSLAVLKRAEGYTAMRLRALITMGELDYASALINEVYDAEEEFFRAAVELRESAGDVSLVVNL
ncbi:Hypothetical protein, putative [Bodo saltans]|uniref:Uncharacterized protein n=1 Tax=Bodo saltans TaxID=75058 RepID=A0A0S4JKT4_BODSA|nr:Hypothetical protein, putative [Bodo saltans]|eukprot:CUG92111.1 Hypothetical protein, putative [Bodo saltans]